MELKLSQELKLAQKLSPLQIQAIKLVELPLLELQQRIRKEIEDNPVLDEASPKQDEDGNSEPAEVSLSEIKEDEIPSYKLYVNNRGKDEMPQYNTFSVKESFTQSLEEQLGYQEIDEHTIALAKFIIGSLDDDGYLRRDTDSLVDDIEFRTGLSTDYDQVEKTIRMIQGFEPAGVCARDLRECLLLQLERMPGGKDIENARTILKDSFADFSLKHFNKIMHRMGIGSEELKAAIAKIVKLDPSPGGVIDDSYSEQNQQVVPDFILKENDGKLELSLPKFSIPELRVNKKYADILLEAKGSHDKEKKDAAIFVKQKLDSAKYFIEAVKQRQNTLLKTMNAILDYQRDFFYSDGDESELRPMVLKDIAAATGFDMSTVSRVANLKYIETPFGIYPLKYFFSEGIKNAEGDTISNTELKKALQECIKNEDKSKPLTDEELVTAMAAKGYKLARRTVVKYRDQFGIPQARLRKEI